MGYESRSYNAEIQVPTHRGIGTPASVAVGSTLLRVSSSFFEARLGTEDDLREPLPLRGRRRIRWLVHL